MTSIVLQRPHTHAGKPFKAGKRLDVDDGTADWLIANGIARRATEVNTTRTDTETKPVQRKESKS
jgi:ribosomal protein L9